MFCLPQKLQNLHPDGQYYLLSAPDPGIEPALVIVIKEKLVRMRPERKLIELIILFVFYICLN